MATPPIKLSNRQIIRIRDGLKSLDGVSGKPGEVIRFDFDLSVSWSITQNVVAIDRAYQLYEIENNKLMRKFGIATGEPITEKNAGKVMEWNEKLEELKDKTQDLVGLVKLRRLELMKAGNIPPGVIGKIIELLVIE